MDTYGLIGYPLGHSFSKTFFNEKFRKEGIRAQYLNFELSQIDMLPQMLKENPELKGFNVTIPYKCQIIPYLDSISEEAREIGAVNVVKVFRSGTGINLKGYNSDTYGFRSAISPMLKSHHKKALILGTGGASKAINYTLKKLGIETLLVSRTPKEGILDYGGIDEAILQEYTIIVNCSPVGMWPNVDNCPDLPYSMLSERYLLFDLVYNPETTLFMKYAQEQGAQTSNGTQMLRLQALAAWDFWQNEREEL